MSLIKIPQVGRCKRQPATLSWITSCAEAASLPQSRCQLEFLYKLPDTLIINVCMQWDKPLPWKRHSCNCSEESVVLIARPRNLSVARVPPIPTNKE